MKLKSFNIFILLFIFFIAGCTNRYQYTRNDQADRYSFFPYLPDYHRDYVHQRFEKGTEGIYLDLVKKYSDQYYIAESLILAIIETESNFNKYAKSSIPAIGLMQIVPGTAGKDVLGWKPTHQYLYNPSNNIHTGTKYLNKIYYDYFQEVRDPLSKEYLTIAAYNTGVGNVLRTFSKNRKYAVKVINSKSSREVYYHLLNKLPYQETKDYLVKVTQRKNKYTGYDG